MKFILKQRLKERKKKREHLIHATVHQLTIIIMYQVLLCSCREDSHGTSLIAGNMAYNKLFSCTCSIYIYSIHFAPHSKVCIQNTLSEILHTCNPTSPLRIVHSFCCSWFFEGDSYKRRVLYWSSFNTGLFYKNSV